MKYRIIALLSLLFLSVTNLKAQNSTPVIFSPYSMYGFGEFVSPANISNRMMGGAGVALYDPTKINYINPAALGSMRQNTALFSFAGEGVSNYFKVNSVDINQDPYTASSLNNSFSLHDVGFAIPLAKGIGLSVSMNPVSSVGYSTVYVDNNQDIIENIGRVAYSYYGEGGLSAVNTSVGMNVVKGLTIGATMIYYFGNIDRYYTAEVVPLLDNILTYYMRGRETYHFSKVSAAFGFQYAARVSKTGVLSFGATYSLPTNFNTTYAREQMLLNESYSLSDTVSMSSASIPIKLPSKLTAGVAYANGRFTVAADYSTQDWTGAYDTDYETTGYGLTRQQQLNLGVSFTPNRYDLRKALNRWTYKAGFIYSTSYYTMTDSESGVVYQPKKIGGTLGVEMPLNRMGTTTLNIGLEAGHQGTTQYNQVSDTYVKVLVGFSLFGDDLWFKRRKLD
ncbi:MAG: hypothetical protein R3Y19_02850 [Rikenellaceae bacterium]